MNLLELLVPRMTAKVIEEGDTSGSQGHTSGCRLIRVVAKGIRAVADLYEW